MVSLPPGCRLSVGSVALLADLREAAIPPERLSSSCVPLLRRGTTGLRVLVGYDRSESLLVAMLMHASLTASSLFILAPSAKGVSLMIYYLLLAAALWVIVAAVAVANGGQFPQQPLPRRGMGEERRN